jgi:hypothetical protein
MLDEDSHPTWSVQVELPPDIDAELRRYVEQDELTSWTGDDPRGAVPLPDCVRDGRRRGQDLGRVRMKLGHGLPVNY